MAIAEFLEFVFQEALSIAREKGLDTRALDSAARQATRLVIGTGFDLDIREMVFTTLLENADPLEKYAFNLSDQFPRRESVRTRAQSAKARPAAPTPPSTGEKDTDAIEPWAEPELFDDFVPPLREPEIEPVIPELQGIIIPT